MGLWRVLHVGNTSQSIIGVSSVSAGNLACRILVTYLSLVVGLHYLVYKGIVRAENRVPQNRNQTSLDPM